MTINKRVRMKNGMVGYKRQRTHPLLKLAEVMGKDLALTHEERDELIKRKRIRDGAIIKDCDDKEG
jgi:hypothetical protein